MGGIKGWVTFLKTGMASFIAFCVGWALQKTEISIAAKMPAPFKIFFLSYELVLLIHIPVM